VYDITIVSLYAPCNIPSSPENLSWLLVSCEEKKSACDTSLAGTEDLEVPIFTFRALAPNVLATVQSQADLLVAEQNWSLTTACPNDRVFRSLCRSHHDKSPGYPSQ